MKKPLYLASDHAGYDLKQHLAAALRDSAWNIEDLGVDSTASCDYPDYAHAVCERVLAHNGMGILICGTGLGMSMTANRHPGIRAALCTHEFHARAAREHNNANVLCLGSRITAPGLGMKLTAIFLGTPFAGGRHSRRVDKIELA